MTVVGETLFVYLNGGKQQKKMHKHANFRLITSVFIRRERNEGNERKKEREREQRPRGREEMKGKREGGEEERETEQKTVQGARRHPQNR